MILRVAFNKKSYLKYIGHLDLMKLFQRTFNKAEIDIKYSQGFNPHPKFSIASPLSLGIESEEEYMDIELNTEIPVEEFMERMNRALPTGIEMIRGVYLDTKEAVASIIAWAFYEITFKTETIWDSEKMKPSINDYMSKEEIFILKKKKKKRKKVEVEVNIRNLIGNVNLKSIDGEKIIVEALLKSGGDGNLKPIQFVNSLANEEGIDIDLESVSIKRIGLYAEENGKIYKPI